MDLSDALFSPSKARQQQAQAKDWIFVDSWLSKKYHPKPVPAFERDEETLQALMTLVAFNERADEEQALVARVERQALNELDGKNYDPVDENIRSTLKSRLSQQDQASLIAQAEAAVVLNAPSTESMALAHSTVELTNSQFDLEQQLAQVLHLQTTLAREMKRLGMLLKQFQSDVFTAPPEISKQTTTWTRDTKTLQLKLAEYNERLSQHRTFAPPRPSIAEVAERQAELFALKQRLQEVEEKIKWYEGLPPDIGEARRVLEDLKSELRGLVERRNTGFEGLVDGGGVRSRLPVRRG